MDTGSDRLKWMFLLPCWRAWLGAVLLISTPLASHALVPLTLQEDSRPVAPAARHQAYLCFSSDDAPTGGQLLLNLALWDWLPLEQTVLNLGFSNQTCWLHLSLAPLTAGTSDWALILDYPLLDEVDVFVRTGSEPPQHYIAGLTRPFAVRPLPYRTPIFPLALSNTDATDILIRIRSHHAVQMPLLIVSDSGLSHWRAQRDLYQALFFGALSVMLLYNLILFISVRETAYLYYVLWTGLLGALMAMMHGYTQQHLWPATPWLGSHALTLLLPAIVLTGSRFITLFLDLERKHPPFARILQWHALGAGALMVSAPFFSPGWLLPLCALLIVSLDITALYIAAHRVAAGDTSARYFALAWLTLLFGALLILLNKFALLPRTPMTEHFLQFGILLDIVLLSLALAARINRLKENELETERLLREVDALKLQSRNQAKNEFLITMSHQIRTPMQGILGMADLLRRPDIGDMQRKQYADTIYNSSRSLISVMNDLLDHSRIESGRLAMAPGSVRPEELVSDVIALFINTAENKNLPIYTYIDSRVPPSIVTDAVRVKQILTNLLSNALKFTERGQIALTVSVRDPTDDIGNLTLLFDVTDTGMGVDEQQRQALFRDDSGQAGLGLVISRKLCALLGGELDITSSPGHGASVHFSLPCRLGPEQANNQQLRGRKVVVITESKALRLSVCQLVSRWEMVPSDLSLVEASRHERLAADQTDLVIVDQRAYLELTSFREPPFKGLPWIVLAPRDQTCIAATPANRPILNLPLEARLLKQTLMSLFEDGDHLLPEGSPASQNDLLPERVLVVDDDHVSQMVISSILSSLNVTANTADTGEHACATVAPAKPHWQVVFMDCEMPGMDGYECTRVLRQKEQEQGRSPCWIIGLSAHAGNEAIKQSEQAGMNDYLCKPVTRDQVKQALQRANWSGRD
jgi:signal transduction histidine kinase/CheY-like chemotaxis protein